MSNGATEAGCLRVAVPGVFDGRAGTVTRRDGSVRWLLFAGCRFPIPFFADELGPVGTAERLPEPLEPLPPPLSPREPVDPARPWLSSTQAGMEAAARSLFEQGYSRAEVAEALGVSRNVAARLLRTALPVTCDGDDAGEDGAPWHRPEPYNPRAGAVAAHQAREGQMPTRDRLAENNALQGIVGERGGP